MAAHHTDLIRDINSFFQAGAKKTLATRRSIDRPQNARGGGLLGCPNEDRPVPPVPAPDTGRPGRAPDRPDLVGAARRAHAFRAAAFRAQRGTPGSAASADRPARSPARRPG